MSTVYACKIDVAHTLIALHGQEYEALDGPALIPVDANIFVLDGQSDIPVPINTANLKLLQFPYVLLRKRENSEKPETLETSPA